MRTQKPSIEGRRPLLFTSGLLLALCFTLVAFEWRTPFVEPKLPPTGTASDTDWELPPITFEQTRPRPAAPAPTKTLSPEIKIVAETSKKEAITEDPLFPDETPLLAATGNNGKDKEVEDIPYVPPYMKFPEVMPSYCGGESAMLAKIYDNVKYPKVPLENGVSGVVYVGFVVRADGTIGDIKVARPLDPWLDAEAMRVVKLLTCFTPGSQAGRPVHVPFMLPIRFKIQ